jgi:hypothetical protein
MHSVYFCANSAQVGAVQQNAWKYTFVQKCANGAKILQAQYQIVYVTLSNPLFPRSDYTD